MRMREVKVKVDFRFGRLEWTGRDAVRASAGASDSGRRAGREA
jgi:hypothetical protein